MRKSTKYIITTAAAATMLLGCVSVAYASTATRGANGWQEITVDREKEWVYYKDGKMVKSDWVCSPASGLWYYMDEDGYMMSDCWGYDRNSEGYWFDEDGVMATGWRLIDLEDDEEGSHGPGSDSNDDEKGYFYFDSSGMVWEGWLNLNGTYYFLNDGYADDFADYQMVYGSVEIDDEEYYFGESNDGSMKKGMVKVVTEENQNTPSATKTETYHLYADNGARIFDGWGKYKDEWYYLDEDGVIVTDGFLYLDKDDAMVDEEDADYIYYMDKNGIMKKGWLELGEEKEIRPGEIKGKSFYYFKSNGAMWTGWLKEGNTYYYMAEKTEGLYTKGEMMTGLQEIDDETYYFDKDGEMAASTWVTIEDEDGEDRSIYLDSKGAMIKGEGPSDLGYATIKGKLYFFDGSGYCIEDKDAIIVSAGSDSWRIGTLDEVGIGDKYYEIGSKGIAKVQTKRDR